MNAEVACGRGHPPAPDRPGDLHSLQHVRGDVPDRRDHARLAQLRRRRRDLQRVQRLHLAVPHRRHRQLAAGGAGAAPTRSTSSSRGTRCRAQDELGARRRRRTSRRTSRASPTEASAGQGGTAAPPWSAAHPYVNLHTLAQPAHRHRDRQLRADRGRRVERHPPHRARLRRDGVPGARRPDDRHRAAGHRRAGAAALRAPVFGREPARRRASGLQQRRADREARHRGPRRASRCAASRRTTCAISPRATR